MTTDQDSAPPRQGHSGLIHWERDNDNQRQSRRLAPTTDIRSPQDILYSLVFLVLGLVYLSDRNNAEVAIAFWCTVAVGVCFYGTLICSKWRRERLEHATAVKREAEARATAREIARLAREETLLEQPRPQGVEVRPRATGRLQLPGNNIALPQGNSPRGADTPIAALTPVRYRKLRHLHRSVNSRSAPSGATGVKAGAAGKENERRCPVCQDNFSVSDEVYELGCTHVFHSTCLKKWLDEANGTCPVCRAAVQSSIPPPTSRLSTRKSGRLP
jgi:hypothetical protein